MNEVFLLKLGELVLKGMNRSRFEQRLISNINYRLRNIGQFNVYAMQSTIYAEPAGSADINAAADALGRVFGVVSVCRSAQVPK